MGQKVNPHGLRVGVIKDWDSRWFADKKHFGDTLVEDYNLRTVGQRKQVVYAPLAVTVHRHGDIRELALDLQRFVAHLFGCVVHTHHQESLAAAFVTHREHRHAILLAVNAHGILSHRRLAGAADGDIADADYRDVEGIGGLAARIVELVPDFERQIIGKEQNLAYHNLIASFPLYNRG